MSHSLVVAIVKVSKVAEVFTAKVLMQECLFFSTFTYLGLEVLAGNVNRESSEVLIFLSETLFEL